MALYPCDVEPHRYRGNQQTIYPAFVNNGSSWRRKLRLCPSHFASYFEILDEAAVDAYAEAPGDNDMRCLHCRSSEPAPTGGFYATVYANNQERRDFWAPVHRECLTAAMEDWLLDATMT